MAKTVYGNLYKKTKVSVTIHCHSLLVHQKHKVERLQSTVLLSYLPLLLKYWFTLCLWIHLLCRRTACTWDGSVAPMDFYKNTGIIRCKRQITRLSLETPALKMDCLYWICWKRKSHQIAFIPAHVTEREASPLHVECTQTRGKSVADEQNKNKRKSFSSVV